MRELPRIGLGTAGLGNLYSQFTDEEANATLEAAWAVGIRYFDTAPLYGIGLSERRLGEFVGTKPREELVVSSKVGRLLVEPGAFPNAKNDEWPGDVPFETYFDYTYDGLMRSYEESLRRLGTDHIDLVVVHDLDNWHHDDPAQIAVYLDQLETSGGRALRELRDAGDVAAIGAGINERKFIPELVERADLDFLLVAGEYTLLRQDILDDEYELCRERGIEWIVGGIFNSGILAGGSEGDAMYDYKAAPSEILERVRSLEAVCENAGVPLAAVALQFALAPSLVVAGIPGASTPEEVETAVALLDIPIPGDVWTKLRDQDLIHASAPVPS